MQVMSNEPSQELLISVAYWKLASGKHDFILTDPPRTDEFMEGHVVVGAVYISQRDIDQYLAEVGATQ